MSSIYFDFNATTPIDSRVRDIMMKWLMRDGCGNPSSPYSIGRKAKDAIERARDQLRIAIGAKDGTNNIFFTSGATESSNWAIKGSAFGAQERLKQEKLEIVTVATEHVATLKTCEYLATRGFKLTVVPVDRRGVVNLEKLEEALTSRTVLVSMMYVNNETGTVQPVARVADLIKRKSHDALFHCDASQAIGRLPVNVKSMGVDLMTIAGHKFHAPKGIGALYVKQGTPALHPILHGGGQEYGMRPGTENTLLVVALGEAASIAHQERDEFVKKMNHLRSKLLKGLTRVCGEDAFVITVPRKDTEVLCNTLHLCFRHGLESSDLIQELGDRVLCSGQSACKTGNSLSHVLKAMNLETSLIRGALRLSLGRTTTEDEISSAVEIIGHAVRSILEKKKKNNNNNNKKDLSTIPVYMTDTHRTTLEGAKVLTIFEIEEERHKIKISDTARFVMILDKTVFHPQGGGQPSDVGEIRFGKKKSYVVSKVVNSPIPSERARGVIWHIGYFASSSSSDSKQEQQEQQEILKESPSQYVDRTSRLLYARLHSAGHLIDVAMQQCGVGLIAGKGFHFPKGSYVEYVGKLNSDIKDTLKDRLQKVLNDLIEKDVPTTIHHVPPSKVPSLCFDGHCGDMSHLPQDKDVRVVCVGGDKGCPCGGTHVKSTKEIEKIIVKKIKNKKGNLRVSYECQ